MRGQLGGGVRVRGGPDTHSSGGRVGGVRDLNWQDDDGFQQGAGRWTIGRMRGAAGACCRRSATGCEGDPDFQAGSTPQSMGSRGRLSSAGMSNSAEVDVSEAQDRGADEQQSGKLTGSQ